MSRDDSHLCRRRVMKTAGAAATGTLAGLAGCSGSGGGGGGEGTETEGGGMTEGGGTETQTQSGEAELEFTIGGVMVPPGSAWQGEQPSGHWEFEKRVEERTDGRIQIKNVAEGQLCTETDCPDKVRNNVVQVASASIGNSSKFFPMNDIWMLPYTFPNQNALAHTLTKPETYEQFWVPFAQEYGVIPIWYHAPALRNVSIGLKRAENADKPHRVPKDLAGLDVRRTLSQVSGKALDAWGANPVSVAWSDTLQGLRTGVVGGMEAALSPVCAYGGNMADSLAESIDNHWTIHNDAKWANVEWLKSLSEENRTVIAEESKRIYRDLVRMNDEIHQKRLGVHTDSPPDSSCTVEHDLQVNYLNESERKKWRQKVSPVDNPDMYSDIIGSAQQIGIDGQAFHEYLRDAARENSIPSSTPSGSSSGFQGWDDFTVDAWWDDYLQEM